MEDNNVYDDYLEALRGLGARTTTPSALARSVLFSRYPQFLDPDKVKALFDDWDFARLIKPPQQRVLTPAKELYADYLEFVARKDRWGGLVGPRMFNEMLDDLELKSIEKRRGHHRLDNRRAFMFGLRDEDFDPGFDDLEDGTDDMGL